MDALCFLFDTANTWAFGEVLEVYAEIRDPTGASGHLAVNFGAHWWKAIGAALELCTRTAIKTAESTA